MVLGAALGAQEPVMSAAWRPDSKVIALGTLHGIELYTDTFQKMAYLEDSALDTGGVSALAWSPDGAKLVSARYDGILHIWDVPGARRLAVLRGHSGAVNGIAWSPDGKIIASAGDDLTVRTWDAATGKPLAELKKHRARVSSVAFNADGKWLVSGGADNAVLLWNVATGQSPATAQAHQGAVLGIAWKSDGSQFVTAGADQKVELWANTGAPLVTLRGHSGQVIAVGWRGDQVLSAGRDGTIWGWSSGESTTLFQAPGLRLAVFSPAGDRAVVVTGDRSASIVSMLDGTSLATLPQDK
jgi:WD40 repeat protein